MTALNFPSSPSNGDVYNNYTYNGTRGIWELTPDVVEINDLSDVNTSSPAEGQALVYNGSQWTNGESAGGFEQHFLLMGA